VQGGGGDDDLEQWMLDRSGISIETVRQSHGLRPSTAPGKKEMDGLRLDADPMR
jgi:hypothetical protein